MDFKVQLTIRSFKIQVKDRKLLDALTEFTIEQPGIVLLRESLRMGGKRNGLII